MKNQNYYSNVSHERLQEPTNKRAKKSHSKRMEELKMNEKDMSTIREIDLSVPSFLNIVIDPEGVNNSKH